MGDHPIAAPTLKKGVSKGHPFSAGYFFGYYVKKYTK
jgi:hypothetical protein